MKPSLICAVVAGLALSAMAPAETPAISSSEGIYRLPYADGTRISVFDDAASHGPRGAVDLVGEPRGADQRHRIVAAADGVVMAIEESHSEQQSGRAAADCRNNYLWLSHTNGEWTLYSHMAAGSSSNAGLKVGSRVRAGQYLGDEAAVGCAMLSHLHFEVAVPHATAPIDTGGFLTDNALRQRIRVPRFCGVAQKTVRKDAFYTAAPCR
jgi:murein DD-endopeptidase MepM/ murein hydrolase activator NlpD